MTAPLSDQKNEWSQLGWGGLFFVLLAFLVYGPALRGDFLWDDDILLTQNSLIREAGGLAKIWSSTQPPDYFPLTYTLFWLEWRSFGLNPFGYHMVSVFLHALGALLLWRVLRCWQMPGAFGSAAIFTVHPVCVASVAWIAELKNTLSLVFYLLTLLAFFRFTATGQRRLYIFALLAFLLALLSKTSVVMLPFLLLGGVWWRQGKLTRTDWLRVVPFFLLSLALGLVTVWFQTHRSIGGRGDAPLLRMASGGWSVWFYLCKAVLPINLNMVYPRWEIRPSLPLAWLPWFLWLGTLGILWKFRNTWGKAPFCALGYFFLTLLPVLGFFDMAFFTYAWAADHLQYLSLIGVIVLASGGAVKMLSKKRMGKQSWFDPRITPLAAGVVITLAVLSWNRAHVFASSENLWTDTLKKNRQAWVAHNNLGDALTAQNKVPEAIEYFKTAVALNSNYVEAYNNLGAALAYLGELDEAVAAYQKALSIRPDFEVTENNLGLIFARQGRLSEAAQHFQNALKITADYPPAHFNLAGTLAQQNQYEAAAEHYRAALRIQPDYVEAHVNLATVLSRIDRWEESALHFQEALRYHPDHAEAQRGLARAKARMR